MAELLSSFGTIEFLTCLIGGIAAIFLAIVGIYSVFEKPPRNFFVKFFGLRYTYDNKSTQEMVRGFLVFALIFTALYAGLTPIGNGYNLSAFLICSALCILRIYIISKIFVLIAVLGDAAYKFIFSDKSQPDK